jgi:hypothetical protein
MFAEVAVLANTQRALSTRKSAAMQVKVTEAVAAGVARKTAVS